MIELATKEMEILRREASTTAAPPRASRSGSAVPPVPSSDLGSDNALAPTPTPHVADIPDLVEDVEMRTYKVLPFGLDKSMNMRELEPADMDKLISVKGLVIRATPVIPDMKEAFFKCTVCAHTVFVSIDRGKIAEPAACPRVACKSKDSMQIVHTAAVPPNHGRMIFAMSGCT